MCICAVRAYVRVRVKERNMVGGGVLKRLGSRANRVRVLEAHQCDNGTYWKPLAVTLDAESNTTESFSRSLPKKS